MPCCCCVCDSGNQRRPYLNWRTRQHDYNNERSRSSGLTVIVQKGGYSVTKRDQMRGVHLPNHRHDTAQLHNIAYDDHHHDRYVEATATVLLRLLKQAVTNRKTPMRHCLVWLPIIHARHTAFGGNSLVGVKAPIGDIWTTEYLLRA